MTFTLLQSSALAATQRQLQPGAAHQRAAGISAAFVHATAGASMQTDAAVGHLPADGFQHGSHDVCFGGGGTHADNGASGIIPPVGG